MKWLTEILSDLVTKITPKQSFITILVIIGLTASYFIYKEYNATMIELAIIQKSTPSSPENYNVERYMNSYEPKPSEKK